jgi:hypothetical protein
MNANGVLRVEDRILVLNLVVSNEVWHAGSEYGPGRRYR